ncbi:unnamed protein product [Pieris brassicae]|uniref:Uncharacterized protein n=1 Tax=Pieris brassicae TaxID=7116 RepID=A0A9P0SM45_PIEBR|nr:unnamed protein product [Pieris brassicae]
METVLPSKSSAVDTESISGEFLVKKNVVPNYHLSEKNFLISLIMEAIDYAAHRGFPPAKLACLMTMYLYTHIHFKWYYWISPMAVWQYFKEIMIRHTIKDSPDGQVVFEPEECYDIMSHFHTMYMTNLPLVHLKVHHGDLTTGRAMATNRSGAQRPNGAPQTKVCQFKLVLLGESAVGKSSLVLRFVKGQFHEYQESTIGAAFLTQTLCLDDTTVKFEIWDTAGQERYHSLAPMYYRGAQAAIVVYDITNQDTFGRAKNWVKELQRQASPSIVIALAGNKSDMAAKRMPLRTSYQRVRAAVAARRAARGVSQTATSRGLPPAASDTARSRVWDCGAMRRADEVTASLGWVHETPYHYCYLHFVW